MQIENQEERSEEISDPYPLFLYAVRLENIRNYYLGVLEFTLIIHLCPNRTTAERGSLLRQWEAHEEYDVVGSRAKKFKIINVKVELDVQYTFFN